MLAEESLSAPDRSSLEICQCRYGVIFDLDLEEVFFFLLLCAVSFRYQWRQPFNEEVVGSWSWSWISRKVMTVEPIFEECLQMASYQANLLFTVT
jgi:hypothetical protein